MIKDNRFPYQFWLWKIEIMDFLCVCFLFGGGGDIFSSVHECGYAIFLFHSRKATYYAPHFFTSVHPYFYIRKKFSIFKE